MVEAGVGMTFGAWSNGTVTVEAGGKDATSPIAAPIKYYKTDGDTSLKTAAELDQLYEEGEFTEVPCQVDQDEIYCVCKNHRLCGKLCLYQHGRHYP